MGNIERHEAVVEPTNKQIKLWRYVDLSKLLATLQHGGLFFPRATLMTDNFEGSTPLKNREARQAMLKAREAGLVEGFGNLTFDQINFAFDKFAEYRQQNLKALLVSCWHMNEFETAAMWKLYAKSGDAVCMQTTFDKLKKYTPGWVYLGEVKYIDYRQDVIDERSMFSFIMHKRRSFENERELRCVIWEHQGLFVQSDYSKNVNEAGLWIGMDLSDLLDAIFVSPDADPWFLEVVRGVVERYGLKVPVLPSSLNETPIY